MTTQQHTDFRTTFDPLRRRWPLLNAALSRTRRLPCDALTETEADAWTVLDSRWTATQEEDAPGDVLTDTLRRLGAGRLFGAAVIGFLGVVAVIAGVVLVTGGG